MDVAVDPSVSKAKFNREVAALRALKDENLRRGWLLIEADFPQIFVVFATPRLNPIALLFGVVLDFTNYDFQPASVRLVHPLTKVPYLAKELPTVLKRAAAVPAPQELVANGIMTVPGEQALMQSLGPDHVPFLCLPGVKEYHDNPGHSGDLWELRRGTGEGTLYFLLDQICKYGIEPVSEYLIKLAPTIAGFRQDRMPE